MKHLNAKPKKPPLTGEDRKQAQAKIERLYKFNLPANY